jgi:hypothetical protein
MTLETISAVLGQVSWVHITEGVGVGGLLWLLKQLPALRREQGSVRTQLATMNGKVAESLAIMKGKLDTHTVRLEEHKKQNDVRVAELRHAVARLERIAEGLRARSTSRRR